MARATPQYPPYQACIVGSNSGYATALSPLPQTRMRGTTFCRAH